MPQDHYWLIYLPACLAACLFSFQAHRNPAILVYSTDNPINHHTTRHPIGFTPPKGVVDE
jgi:hypothetical protein